jgi:hypothetical protein
VVAEPATQPTPEADADKSTANTLPEKLSQRLALFPLSLDDVRPQETNGGVAYYSAVGNTVFDKIYRGEIPSFTHDKQKLDEVRKVRKGLSTSCREVVSFKGIPKLGDQAATFTAYTQEALPPEIPDSQPVVVEYLAHFGKREDYIHLRVIIPAGMATDILNNLEATPRYMRFVVYAFIEGQIKEAQEKGDTVKEAERNATRKQFAKYCGYFNEQGHKSTGVMVQDVPGQESGVRTLDFAKSDK